MAGAGTLEQPGLRGREPSQELNATTWTSPIPAVTLAPAALQLACRGWAGFLHAARQSANRCSVAAITWMAWAQGGASSG